MPGVDYGTGPHVSPPESLSGPTESSTGWIGWGSESVNGADLLFQPDSEYKRLSDRRSFCILCCLERPLQQAWFFSCSILDPQRAPKRYRLLRKPPTPNLRKKRS